MEIDTLQAELERLFDLNSLLDLTRNVLGFDPEYIGGTAAVGSYAQALIRHCIQVDALEALCDAVRILKPNAGPAVDRIRRTGVSLDVALDPGSSLGEIQVARALGEGRVAFCYVGQYGARQVRAKVLKQEATRDRRGLSRFAAITRLSASIRHPSLPSNVFVAVADERLVVVHDYVEGQTLAQRLARSGPIHIMEALPLLTSVLDALSLLHEQRIAHGDLRLENIVVCNDVHGQARVLLLDAGTDRLRSRARDDNELECAVLATKAIAPELLNGGPATLASDVYAFGAMLYELLTGQAPFKGSATDVACAHLTEEPEPPSFVAPRGWVNRELDEFVLSLLEKNPKERPAHAQAMLDRMRRIGRFPSFHPTTTISNEDLARRIETLSLEPENVAAIAALEEALSDGADPERIAEAFRMAALDLDAQGTPKQRKMRKEHFNRAAEIYEHTIRDLEKAESMYLWALNTAPEDDTVMRALERVRRSLGKFEEIIEMLLNRGEQADTAEKKGRTFFEIGRIYRSDLADLDQALVAFTQAYCEDPNSDEYAEEIEKLAGSKQEAWAEIIESCNGALQDEAMAPETKKRLMVRVGRWYDGKLGHPDMALPCYQTILSFDATYEPALEAMAQLYKKGQQWPELYMVLTRWADSAQSPSKAREVRVDAGELAERQLNDLAGARALYEAVLAEDPTNERACDGLCRACERDNDSTGLVKVLQTRALALRGDARISAMLRVAETYENKLNADAESVKILDQLFAEFPDSLEVTRALERVYGKVGKYTELLALLERQVAVATTPRQKTQLFERIAAIYEEEFLDNERASAALHAVLSLDPNHEGALASLARISRTLGNWEEVANLLDRQLALATEPSRKVALALQLGRVLAEQLSATDRAMEAFELVLSFEPQQAEALEMVARLRSSLGDAGAALAAIDLLAAKATNPQAKAEHLWRAAKLLEERGDLDQAIDYYKQALDAVPEHPATTQALRQAYLTKGDSHAAVQLLDQEISRTSGDRAKAKLYGEKALILHEQIRDLAASEDAAKAALSRDPTSVEALLVLGDVAFDAGRFIEAAKNYAPLVDRVDSLPQRQATRVLKRVIETLTKTDATDRAHAAADALIRICPDDVITQLAAFKPLFEKGDAAKCATLYGTLLSRFEGKLDAEQQSQCLYRYGESLRRSGNPSAAVQPLEQACELDPNAGEPLAALATAYGQLNRHTDVVKTKYRHLDIAIGDERVQLLIDLGDIIAEKFGDRPRAIQSLVAALEDRPDDRRLLTKLMQLYSDEKDWTNLVSVVMRLAEFVDDTKQRAKYLHTAAIVTARHLGNVEGALELFEQVIDLDPTITKALSEATELHRSRGDFAAVERLLRRRLDAAAANSDVPTQLETCAALAELYTRDLGWTEYAIAILEQAQSLDPTNLARTVQLAELCETDLSRYATQAIAAHVRLIDKEPGRTDSYRALRRIHSETQNADGAWCLCQALSVMRLADPDEERYYKHLRAQTAAPAQAVFSEPDWAAVTHPDTNPLLTAVFAIIEPAVIAARAPELASLGYHPSQAIELTQHPSPMPQTLYYAAGVMGIQAPPAFIIPDDPGGLSFLHAKTTAIGLGRVAMSSKVPPQAAAFIAARQLSYLRPGFYMRQLLMNAAGLKAWLFAAIKLVSPQFPITPDLEGPVKDAMATLGAGLHGPSRDELARIVSTILREGAALDLKKWVSSVDLSADRAGFVLAHDLETAAQIINASDESTSAVPGPERLRQTTLFSISPEYLTLRQRLGITVGG